MFAKSSNHASDKTAEAEKWQGMLSSDKSTEEAAFAHPAVVATTMGRGHQCHGPRHWPGRTSAAPLGTATAFCDYLEAGLAQQPQVAVRPP